jgi:hypothetical protein
MALTPAEEMRRQLDALMGTTRNESGSRAQKFTDPEICRSYCSGLCPHDLFTNTKKDMGACPKLHSLPMKQLYEQERKNKDYGFEKELARILYDLIAECDRECERQNNKLKETEEEKLLEDPINRQLSELQSQADRLGEEGKIDEYLKVNSQMDLLKAKQKEQAQQLPDGIAGQMLSQLYNGRVPQVQKLKTCEICACYLSKFDNDQRLVEGHYLGKLHTGYKEIREKFAELKKGGFFEEPPRRDNYDDRRNSTVKRRDDDHRPRDHYRDNRDNRDYRDRRDNGRDNRDNRDYRDNRGRDNRDRDYRDNRDRGRDNRDRDRDQDRGDRGRDRDRDEKRRRSRSK